MVSVLSLLMCHTKSLNKICLLVYPNPAQDLIHMYGLRSGSVVLLYDLNGRLMLYVPTESNALDLNITSLAIGFYFIKVIDPSGNVGVLKLQKE